MARTLKNLVDNYKQGLLDTPNIQITNMRLSDEVLNFPSYTLSLDVSFSNCLVKKSYLTSIKISKGNFELGFFTQSTFENCTFKRTNFQELECKKCIFQNCSFIDCKFVDSTISETIFSNCKFEKGTLESADFRSCEFIDTNFSEVILIFTTIYDSKFSKFNKSIKFEREFFLNDILSSKNGILGIFEENYSTKYYNFP